MKLHLILLLIVFDSCAQNVENTITLIPAKHIGPVCINLNVKDGLPKEYENENRVYRIGKEGLLNTQFQAIYGQYQFNKYYYENENGQRQEIKFLNVYDEQKKLDLDSIYIFGVGQTGTGEGFDEHGTFLTAPRILFYVGKYEDTEKKAHEQMQFGFKNQKIIGRK